MITVEEAKKLEHGTILYYSGEVDSKGEPQQYRVSGKPKTWKTRPQEVEVPLKYGLYGNTRITERDLNLFSFKKWRATGTKITFKKPARYTADAPIYMVVLGKIKVPYKNEYVDREIGSVWRGRDYSDSRWCWFHGQAMYGFKTRQEAAEHLLDSMLD